MTTDLHVSGLLRNKNSMFAVNNNMHVHHFRTNYNKPMFNFSATFARKNIVSHITNM